MTNNLKKIKYIVKIIFFVSILMNNLHLFSCGDMPNGIIISSNNCNQVDSVCSLVDLDSNADSSKVWFTISQKSIKEMYNLKYHIFDFSASSAVDLTNRIANLIYKINIYYSTDLSNPYQTIETIPDDWTLNGDDISYNNAFIVEKNRTYKFTIEAYLDGVVKFSGYKNVTVDSSPLEISITLFEQR